MPVVPILKNIHIYFKKQMCIIGCIWRRATNNNDFAPRPAYIKIPIKPTETMQTSSSVNQGVCTEILIILYVIKYCSRHENSGFLSSKHIILMNWKQRKLNCLGMENQYKDLADLLSMEQVAWILHDDVIPDETRGSWDFIDLLEKA